MKPFAKKFYHSKQWRETRDAFFISKDGLCERCGRAGAEVHHRKPLTVANINDPDITLAWDNLELLCRDCHFQAHDKKQNLKHKPKTELSRYTFDEDGNIVPTGQVIIVWGAPASGKTTYARNAMGQGDILVDVDQIIQCFTGLSNKDTDNRLIRPYLPFALAIRDYIYRLIADEAETYNIATAYVIAGLPSKAERLELANRLQAKLIHIDTPREDCIAQAQRDTNRTDKAHQEKIINNYFERLEL